MQRRLSALLIAKMNTRHTRAESASTCALKALMRFAALLMSASVVTCWFRYAAVRSSMVCGKASSFGRYKLVALVGGMQHARLLLMSAVLTACMRLAQSHCLSPDDEALDVMVLFSRAAEVCVSGSFDSRCYLIIYPHSRCIGLDAESSYEIMLAHRASDPAILSSVFECDGTKAGLRSLLNTAVGWLVQPQCEHGRLLITAAPEGLLQHHPRWIHCRSIPHVHC